jgi:DNA-binding LacI/PurR family transcriptional regulator
MVIGFALGRVAPETAHRGFWGELVAGVDDGANAEKHNLLIVRSTEKLEAVDRGLELLQERQIDALVIPGVLYGDKMPQIEALDAPIVLVLPLRPSHHPRVGINHEPGLRQAAQHLHALGHSEVLWAGLSVGGKVQEVARKGFFDHAAQELGMRTREMIIRGGDIPQASGLPSLVEAAREQFAAHLSVQGSPTAIMAYNEIAGMGICAALTAAGRCVPQDVSVIGYDDLVAEMAIPPMTVISHKLREAGQAAARLGIQMASDRKRQRELRGHEEWIPTELVVRASTGPCRSHGMRPPGPDGERGKTDG